jgi:alpha-glucosidase
MWAMAFTLVGLAAPPALNASPITVVSPSRRVELIVDRGADGRLRWRVSLDRRPVVEPSRLGILLDGVDLGEGAVPARVERYRVKEDFPVRGVHARASVRGHGARVACDAGGTSFTLDLRALDDAVALRFQVPGAGTRIPDAASVFRLPAGSTVFYHGARDHYEGLYARHALEDVASGDWAAPPLTFRLPGGAGYASITEAGLRGYAGFMLQADGRGGFVERLGHAVPASYPYTLRYGEDNAKRLAAPAAIEGPITTPWRVVLLGRDLQALVTSDAIPSLVPPPDPKLFPQGVATPWLRPGRAVWRYLDGGDASLEGIKEFSRLAGELGFEHHIVEGQWRKWTEDELRELVEYSRARGVSVWVWLHSRDQLDPEERRRLFARLHRLGVAGVKVDFLDHEAREVVEHYEAILRDAAEQQLLVNFHGANKPTGEWRTWPNEMTREAIRGLEYRSTPGWAEHDTIVPFTRFLAGPADYTPLVFAPERRKDTTAAHQVATVVVFTSPVMVYGAHPRSLLESPAVDLIRSLPSVWDETRVLAPSEVGEAAVFARRRGSRWFVGVLNGTTPRAFDLDLSFLGRDVHRAMLVRDKGEDGAAVAVEERALSGRDRIPLSLRPGGGFVARFSR